MSSLSHQFEGEDYGDQILSKAIKAGRRTYFLDVRATRGGDYFLTITESRKVSHADGTFSFDRHKIFLYKEDFEKFLNELQNAIGYVESVQGNYNRNYPTEQFVAEENNNEPLATEGEIKIDIDF